MCFTMQIIAFSTKILWDVPSKRLRNQGMLSDIEKTHQPEKYKQSKDWRNNKSFNGITITLSISAYESHISESISQ